VKKAIVNGRWQLWLPNSIADWDAITGDPVARRGWEYERFRSFRERLRWGDKFFDVGTEHGWIAGVLAQEFVNPVGMHLFEPSPDFWVNIRKIWAHNNLDQPGGMIPCFVSDHSDLMVDLVAENPYDAWPESADLNAPEIGGMAYRDVRAPGHIHSITIDDYVHIASVYPNAINIDVEGAELMVLRGAFRTLQSGVSHVWVSIHPDLMENYGHSKDELLDFMRSMSYEATYLGTDHEEHWLFRPEPF